MAAGICLWEYVPWTSSELWLETPGVCRTFGRESLRPGIYPWDELSSLAASSYSVSFRHKFVKPLVTKERLLAHSLPFFFFNLLTTSASRENGTKRGNDWVVSKIKKNKKIKNNLKTGPKLDDNIFPSLSWQFWSICHNNFFFDSMTLSLSLIWILTKSLPVLYFPLTSLSSKSSSYFSENKHLITFLVLVALSSL